MSSIDLDPCQGTLVLENAKFAKNSDGKVVVRVADDDALAVLQQILGELGGAVGTKFFAEDARATTVGVEQTTISETVPVGKTRSISKVVVTCRQSVKYQVFIDGVVVGSGRTSAAKHTDAFTWLPTRDASAGQVIEVKVLQTYGPASDVETYLMATDV